MIKNYFLITCFLFLSSTVGAQQWYQYFDGADTSSFTAILIQIDTTGGNVWQIGPPQKQIFDSAASVPNVLVTDTINSYPANDSSSFSFATYPWMSWGIFALQWKQKLDLDSAQDVGVIEYSPDGITWTSVFDNPFVYNFYGFDTVNVDTVASGVVGFTGTDSTWSDIWLCFQMSWLQQFNDSIRFRYTIYSDSTDNQSEGWMIDNMMMHITIVHTAKGEQKEEYMKVFPSVTTGIVNIETVALQEYHIIETMQLVDVNGKVVKEWKNVPTRFWIDISDQPNGSYFLKVTTNKQTNTFPVILQR
ncbi:MAG TPA: T9SS type A sorting domain-containing protein [Bacteroidia bacterium]|nr:T9SS type A sorting domain-containing protein [Bacteroidia bacterium]